MLPLHLERRVDYTSNKFIKNVSQYVSAHKFIWNESYSFQAISSLLKLKSQKLFKYYFEIWKMCMQL